MGRAVGAAVLLAAAVSLASCRLLTDLSRGSYSACGVYPAVPVDPRGSAGRAAAYYHDVLLPEATTPADRRELRREARSSPFFLFFRPGDPLTYRGRDFEHHYLVRVEDAFGDYWTHENELDGLETLCPLDEP